MKKEGMKAFGGMGCSAAWLYHFPDKKTWLGTAAISWNGAFFRRLNGAHNATFFSNFVYALVPGSYSTSFFEV
jgi:hypothetical protein